MRFADLILVTSAAVATLATLAGLLWFIFRLVAAVDANTAAIGDLARSLSTLGDLVLDHDLRLARLDGGRLSPPRRIPPWTG